MYFKTVCTLICLLPALLTSGQTFRSSSEILHELKKLQNSTSVLYLAAHPDDENTRMISWLVNGYGARTAYLSLTRGDGGQNLIGTELSATLGVLRTQELLHAREIDGGEQFFSRAVDFGYSKNAKETLSKWDRQAVLSDVVYVMRTFRPDVIITRFPPDSRGGHGHHTASAILGIEAFKLAADEDAFPEQLQLASTWQPKRIYWNASTWWNRKLDSIAEVDEDYLKVEVGGYNPLQGTSYNELASLSRTQHKSQGFGVSIARGAQTEYLKYLAGDKAQENLFEDIPKGWERFGFKTGDKMLLRIIASYDPLAPHKSVPDLVQLYKAAQAINDDLKRDYFRAEVKEIIVQALGLYAEALSPEEFVVPGEELTVQVNLLQRNPSASPVMVQSMHWMGNPEKPMEVGALLALNQPLTKEFTARATSSFSQPYWLMKDFENLYRVEDQRLIGTPENKPSLYVDLHLLIAGEPLSVEVPVRHKYTNRVEGEIIHPVVVVPPLVVDVPEENLLFYKNKPQDLNLLVRSFSGNGTLKLEAEGWTIEPPVINIEETGRDKTNSFTVRIAPGESARATALRMTWQESGEAAYSLAELDYPHIKKQVVFSPATVDLIPLNLRKKGILIGYIPGAGDKVAEAIMRMGYEVDLLGREEITTMDLSNYKAIVAGIRAYNTEEWLPGVKNILMDYVKNGGNYIVQYNTRSRDLLSVDLGPYPFEISRERVTEEDAEVTFLEPDHPVLNRPNTLTPADFENWVQERGLYFAGSWSEEYATPLGWHDGDEPSRNGGLLIGHYGKGTFIYTGISFFRELPAGVPGAYRLLANILSYSNPAKNEQP